MLYWNIEISQQDSWWKISSNSPLSGSLNPGEYLRVWIEVNRAGKAKGEYIGRFVVKSYGIDYQYTQGITIIMEVGIWGPELVNINTNTGSMLNSLILTFDKIIQPSSADKTSNYTISPSTDVLNVAINDYKIFLTTAEHNYDIDYTIAIHSIKDTQNRIKTNQIGYYRFYNYCAGPDLIVSGSSKEYEWDVALPGKKIYNDRDYVLYQVPDEYTGCAMLRTNCEDNMDDNLKISFTVNCENTKVILAYDPRKSSAWNCEWVESCYTKLSKTIPVNAINSIAYFDLYESNDIYQPGQVVNLYQNGALVDDDLMYFVLIKGFKPKLNIAGNVSYYSTGTGVADVIMSLTGGMTNSINIDNSGDYIITELDEGFDYTITPSKTGDISRTTITMHDASLAAKIAAQIISEPTETQIIAADVDDNDDVTIDDAYLIAMYVIGMIPDSNCLVGEWLFQPHYRSYTPLDATKLNQNFSAIVSGDVDGNWTPEDSSTENLATKGGTINLADMWEIHNDQLIIKVTAEPGEEMFSFDIILKYNPLVLKFNKWHNIALNRQFNVLTSEGEEGCLRLGGYSIQPITEQGTYLKIVFDITGENGDISKIELEHYINGENFCSAAAAYIVRANSTELPRRNVLLQNYPNPFNPKTIIHYELNNITPQRTVIQVYNIKGELINTLVDKIQPAGQYTISWSGKNEYGCEVTSGLYLIQVKTKDVVLMKKTVKLK